MHCCQPCAWTLVLLVLRDGALNSALPQLHKPPKSQCFMGRLLVLPAVLDVPCAHAGGIERRNCSKLQAGQRPVVYEVVPYCARIQEHYHIILFFTCVHAHTAQPAAHATHYVSAYSSYSVHNIHSRRLAPIPHALWYSLHSHHYNT